MNRIFRAGAAGLCLAGAAIAAWASETVAYTYDARGRLVKVVRAGSVNNNVSAEYKYDRADNRTNVTILSPNLPPPPPPNNPPTPVADTGAQEKCTAQAYIVTANDTDPDGDYPLSLVSVSGVGFAILSSTTLQFNSTSSTGAKVGTYTVQDSRGATASGTLTVIVSGGACS